MPPQGRAEGLGARRTPGGAWEVPTGASAHSGTRGRRGAPQLPGPSRVLPSVPCVPLLRPVCDPPSAKPGRPSVPPALHPTDPVFRPKRSHTCFQETFKEKRKTAAGEDLPTRRVHPEGPGISPSGCPRGHACVCTSPVTGEGASLSAFTGHSLPSGPTPVGSLCPLLRLGVCGDAFPTVGLGPWRYSSTDTCPTLSRP